MLQILLPTLAAALPTDGHVAAGQATIQQSTPKTLTIQQTTDKAILNWKSFSIGADEAVRFAQPSVNSIALNRVIGVDPSIILGRLEANGRIFLINPNGILFGAGSQINVAGLLATTLQLRDEDFMAGRYLFAQDPLKELQSVVNRGAIHVSDHGFVILAAPAVSNEGIIVANLSTTLMASGHKMTLDLMGDGLINYAISEKVLDKVMGPDGKPLDSAVSNSGSIQADGGHVILHAKASGDVFSSVVNQSGIVRARSLENSGGIVKLIGGDESLAIATAAGAMRPSGDARGAVINSGAIDVSAAAPNATPGAVVMVGERVGHSGLIEAAGAEAANGGDIVMASTARTLLSEGSAVNVSGIGQSSGGRLRVWSDQETFVNSGTTILARGGELGGNGGFVELSGKEHLGFAGSVNALAPHGLTGTLLLDPRNITIAAAGGSAYNSGVNNLFGNTPAADVIITPASINGAAANVVLQANNDITVTNAIGMTNNGVGLTMQAGRDITVNAAITTNNGNISLTANDSSALAANRLAGTGDLVFGAAGHLNAGSGNIVLNVGSSAAAPFNPGSITTVRNLTTTTGSIGISSPNTVTLSGAVNAGSGTIAINANTDGAGAQGVTMNAGSSISTTNAAANAIQINVNGAAGGTGAVALRNITANTGGLQVATNAGGNTTGGAITQAAATSVVAGSAALSTGNSAVTLNNATNDFGTASISRATNVTLRDANALTLGTSTISGTLGVTTAGALTQSGALAVAGATTLAAGATNDITLNNAANNFGTISVTNGRNVSLRDANALALGTSTVSGTLGVISDGAITQSGALTVTGATALTAGTANNITLNNAANNFSSVGIVSGNNVTLRDANTLNLGASTVAGTLNLTTAGAVTQSGALAVTGTATVAAGAGNDITLNAANDFSTLGITNGRNIIVQDVNGLNVGASTISGNVALTVGGTVTQSGAISVAGATSITATAPNTDILLGSHANNVVGALTFGGTLGNIRDVALRNTNVGTIVPPLGSLVNLRNLTLIFNNAPMVLPSLTLAAGGSLTATAGGAISQTGALVVPGITTLTAGTVNNITLSNAANDFGTLAVVSGNNVNLRDSNALVLGASTVSGMLNIATNGALTQSGALNVTGVTTLAAGAGNDINLATSANNFSTVAVTSGNNVNLRDNNALVLGASTVSGALNVTTNGALTQSGALTVAGTTTLAVGATNNITLNNAANNFVTVAVASGNNVNLRDANALTLDASTISGTLAVTTAGALTQSGALTVTGTTTLAAGTANNITLNNAANNFATVGITSGNSVSLTDANALNLAASTVSGPLGITANGALTQSGALTVTGATTLAAGLGNDITLNAGNNFSSVGIASGNNVTLRDTNALVLGASTVSGTLNVTTAGALSQSGPLAVTGATTLASGAANDITLNNPGNTFSTVGITTGRNVTLADANALNIAASTVSGTLAVSTNGALTQSGALTVTGTTTLATGPGSDITLNNAANNFSTVGITSGNNVTLGDANALTLGASTVSGTLNVAVNGTLTQSGVVTASGATILAAGTGNDITLANAGNNFSTLGVGSGRNVTLRDSNGLVLGTSTVSGNLAVTTGGSVTQSGALSVSGTTSFTATAANTDILLASHANNFGGAVSLGGTLPNFRDVQLRNVNAGGPVPSLAGMTNLRNLTLIYDNAPIVLPALTLAAGGNLNVTAGGTITDSGNVLVPGTTTLAAGANSITLDNANNFTGPVSVINGNNVTLNDINALVLGPSTISGNLNVTTAGAVTQTGAVTVAGATTVAAAAGTDIVLSDGSNNFSTVTVTGGNNVTLRDADAIALTLSNISGSLTLGAGGNVTVNAATGNLLLNSVTTPGSADLSATNGSILSGGGGGPHLTAGAASTLQALNGIVGTQSAPVNVLVNGGSLGIRATTAVMGISGFLTGTVPGNVLTLLNVPPGLVCFNGCPVPTTGIGMLFSLASGVSGSLNRDAIVPAYYPEPTRVTQFSQVTSEYVPATVVAETPVTVDGSTQSVAREVPPCYPASACKPGATILTVPADEQDPELPAAK